MIDRHALRRLRRHGHIQRVAGAHLGDVFRRRDVARHCVGQVVCLDVVLRQYAGLVRRHGSISFCCALRADSGGAPLWVICSAEYVRANALPVTAATRPPRRVRDVGVVKVRGAACRVFILARQQRICDLVCLHRRADGRHILALLATRKAGDAVPRRERARLHNHALDAFAVAAAAGAVHNHRAGRKHAFDALIAGLGHQRLGKQLAVSFAHYAAPSSLAIAP